jgi:hypothetical protein
MVPGQVRRRALRPPNGAIGQRGHGVGLGPQHDDGRQARPAPAPAGLVCRCRASTPIWVKKSAGSLAIGRPRKSFTCDSPISTAMPLVKPMTMDTGM